MTGVGDILNPFLPASQRPFLWNDRFFIIELTRRKPEPDYWLLATSQVSTRWLRDSFRVCRSAYLISPPMGNP